MGQLTPKKEPNYSMFTKGLSLIWLKLWKWKLLNVVECNRQGGATSTLIELWLKKKNAKNVHSTTLTHANASMFDLPQYVYGPDQNQSSLGFLVLKYGVLASVPIVSHSFC